MGGVGVGVRCGGRGRDGWGGGWGSDEEGWVGWGGRGGTKVQQQRKEHEAVVVVVVGSFWTLYT